jgi:hypothetical protein
LDSNSLINRDQELARALLLLGCGYGALTLLLATASCACAFQGQSEVAISLQVLVISIVSASATYCAWWSVFGLGSYFWRFFLSAAAFLVVSGGTILALRLYSLTPTGIIHVSASWEILKVVPLLAVVGQTPFWLLRIFGGWQYVRPGQPPARRIELRDLFTIVLLCSIASIGLRSVILQSKSRVLDHSIFDIDVSSDLVALEYVDTSYQHFIRLATHITTPSLVVFFVTCSLSLVHIWFLHNAGRSRIIFFGTNICFVAIGTLVVFGLDASFGMLLKGFPLALTIGMLTFYCAFLYLPVSIVESKGLRFVRSASAKTGRFADENRKSVRSFE